MTTTKNIQKQINQLFAIQGITGEVIINIEVKADNYKEVDQYQNMVTNALTAPKSVRVNEHGNAFYNKQLTVWLSFNKI